MLYILNISAFLYGSGRFQNTTTFFLVLINVEKNGRIFMVFDVYIYTNINISRVENIPPRIPELKGNLINSVL